MRYVILGSSAAGVHGAMELRRLDKESEIWMISRDTEIYSRCILHHYLGGERSMEQLSFVERDFADRYIIQWMKGRTCAALHPGQRQVELEDGERVSYDKLLIATGSHTYIPPVKNLKEASNVCGFRNIEDMEVLREAAGKGKHMVVMGAGLVGLDCVTGLLRLGVKASLVESAGWLLSRQLDKRGARSYEEAFAREGIAQYYGVGIEEAVLDAKGQIQELVLTDKRRLPCDFLVVTAGVRPNVEFLEGSGIQVGKQGLLYDASGKTSDDRVYGAGDVSGASPIWPAAVKEGIVAAANMAGEKRRMEDFFASKATMNFLGIPTMSLGEVNPEEGSCQVEIREEKNAYKKIVHQNGRITGAVLQGDLAYSGILQQLIARRIDITKVKKPVFDIDYSDFFHMKENFEYTYED